jgi:hypothetical protein
MPSNIQLFRRHNYNPIFIETGSYAGEGIKNAIFAGYKIIYSIELAEKHYNYCKSYFKYNDNVNLLHGDSLVELPNVLKKLNEPATFWLDAHYSGGDTDFTNNLTPLMKELGIIKSHFIKTHTIIIDDLREWSRDFPAIGFNVEDIKNKILEISPDYIFSFADGHIAGDILVAEIKKVKPINIVVFSKDRAMQLELFIRSFNVFVKNADQYVINILYAYSLDEFMQGYVKLCETIPPNVIFHKETDFRSDLICLIGENYPHTVFFTDDDVFINNFDFYDKQMDAFEWDDSIICRSLRLNKSLTYCYSKQTPMKQPPFFGDNTFNWKGQDGDYGYPMSLDGHIFRTKEILSFLIKLDYTSPNTLESSMAKNTKGFPPKMICYDKSMIINNPINIVQNDWNNVHGKIDAEFLNERFLNGQVIELSNFIGINNTSCHQEIPLKFKQT